MKSIKDVILEEPCYIGKYHIRMFKDSKCAIMHLLINLALKYPKGEEFFFTNEYKDILSKRIGLKPTSFSGPLRELIKKDFIIKTGSRTYKLNPICVTPPTDNKHQLKIISLYTNI